MPIKTNLIAGFNTMISRVGKPIRLRYYSLFYNDVYDDDVRLTQSGTDVWTSGIVLPLQNKDTASFDFLLTEQGKLSYEDQRLYVNGSLLLVGSNIQCKIGVGSPNYDQFSVIPLGGIPVEWNDSKIYKKAYIRRLTNGSLIGEV